MVLAFDTKLKILGINSIEIINQQRCCIQNNKTIKKNNSIDANEIKS